MASRRFLSESLQDCETIGAFLEALNQGLRQGRLSLAQGEEELEFLPDGLIDFAVEGKIKGQERKIKISLTWKEPKEESGRESSPKVKI